MGRKSLGAQFGRQNTRYGIRRIDRGYSQPFWLPASSYYFLAVAVAIAVFFVSWWFLDNGNISESPWILSGVLSSIVLVLAGLLREIVLKDARKRYIAAKVQLDRNVGGFSSSSGFAKKKPKLSINLNSAILKDIEKKSAAANTLKQLPDVHLEVFELCEEYLQMTKRELNTIGVGSPRFGSIRLGMQRVKKLHRFHLLAWAAVESGIYTEAARKCETTSEKFETADRALTVLNSALEFYPNELQLIESAGLVKEFTSSAKISNLIEQAEHAVFRKDNNTAIGLYRDALFYLARDEIKNENKDAIAEKINSEIKMLRDNPYRNSEAQRNMRSEGE